MAQELDIKVTHVVAESTNLLSTYQGGGHIYSVVNEADMDNGMLVARAEYAADEYEDEVWNTKQYAAGDEALLILTPPLLPMVDIKGYTTEDKFYNAAGEICRAYTLHVGDRFSVSEKAFDTAPDVKKYVTFDAVAKQYKAAEGKQTGQFCAQVLTKTYRDNMTMYKLQVVAL